LIEADVRFCIRCGSALENKYYSGRIRPTCPKCAWVYFSDPKVAVVAVVIQSGRVLLIRRLNEPRQGLWSLPGGFMDAGEDPAEAASRECLEETGLIIRVTRLIDVVSGRVHPRGADLLLAYRAEALSGEIIPGDDAGEAAFFAFDSLPPLAFESTSQVLTHLQGGGTETI
jgi:8-oxo-dGTP diphosphatase